MIYDDTLIAEGIKSAIASYYMAKMITTKNEEESKKEVVILLDNIRKLYYAEKYVPPKSYKQQSKTETTKI